MPSSSYGLSVFERNETINNNEILERTKIENEIKTILHQLRSDNISNSSVKKGIYIYGSPGCGKTFFIKQLLKEMNFDTIHYDAGDIRNKSLINTITSNNMSNKNVLTLMKKQTQNIAIIMDEIDGINNGDKGSITALIKLIRQKKTKKQKLESKTLNPIVCIGNYFFDKKIKELMKVCNVFELKTPTNAQMVKIINHKMPDVNKETEGMLLNYIQGDMRKLDFLLKVHKKNPSILFEKKIQKIFELKTNNDDSKKITQSLIHKPIPLREHTISLNETDRTIVALLWHENVVDALSIQQQHSGITHEKIHPMYLNILENICFADYIDRITFQNQIWQFNEMSSLIKTFHCNKIYHDFLAEHHCLSVLLNEIRFTKVLTKYSTEYNNSIFIYNLCNEMEMDKKDLISCFQELRMNYNALSQKPTQDLSCFVENKIHNTNIDKLDIKRMYRYLDKNVKKEMTPFLTDEYETDEESLL